MKIAGNVDYPWMAYSPSDSASLGFTTEFGAKAHADNMNKLLDSYPLGWNTEYWATKPDNWIVEKNDD